MAVNDYPSIHSGNTIDTRVSQVANNTADIAALKSRMNQAEADLEAKADATAVTAVNSRVGGVEATIPSSATTSNKLVDKAYLDNALAGKVDVNGSKGLSTNDFTNAYKTKLDGLPTGLAISNALDGKASTSSVSDVSSRVTAVEVKIPSAATSSNQLADKAFVNNGLSGKQATLVSGTNIKTVNGESILGSGNIVAGDPNAVKYVTQSLTESQKAQARTNIGAASVNDVGNVDYVVEPTLPTASASTMGHIYLIGPDASNNYNRYITQKDGNTYSWIPLGSTAIDLSSKQDTLVGSGTGQNIKTINNQNILGSGNIDAGSLVTIDSALSTTSTNPVQNKVITSALNTFVSTDDLEEVQDVEATLATVALRKTAQVLTAAEKAQVLQNLGLNDPQSGGTTQASAIPANGLAANVYYELGELSADISVTLDSTTEESGKLNIYTLAFSLGATTHNVTLPSVLWPGGTAPTFETGKSYEVQFVNGRGSFLSFE